MFLLSAVVAVHESVFAQGGLSETFDALNSCNGPIRFTPNMVVSWTVTSIWQYFT
jgi:hypothetical protein